MNLAASVVLSEKKGVVEAFMVASGNGWEWPVWKYVMIW